MKRPSSYLVLLGIVVWLTVPMRLMAGQIITPEVREWAKGIISQEVALETIGGKRTIAVFPFVQSSGDTFYSPLQTGMAVMIITDLAKIKDLHLVDRIRIKALIQELAISESGLIQPDTGPRLGYFLSARWVVGGIFGLPEKDMLEIEARLLETSSAHLIGNPGTQGALTEIFSMEKTLVKAIVRLLNISLSPEEEDAVSKYLTVSLEALLALSRGLEACDIGEYSRGASEFRKALKEDPGLSMAKEALEELRSLGQVSPVSHLSSWDLLDDLRNETSLNDTLPSTNAIKRTSDPATVEAATTGFINLPPGFIGPDER
jgi:TolB-like protein